jgi:hypothetical protein
MNERTALENAFGLRWIQDDDQGRLITGPGAVVYRSPADAIRTLGLGCDEASLKENLDRFPPHLRIHGGYAPGVGDPVTRFSLTWEPGSAEAGYVQSVDEAGEGISGTVDVPPDGNLKEVLKGLLIPDAQDVVSQYCEEGRPLTLKGVDFWIGDQHFKVSDAEEA